MVPFPTVFLGLLEEEIFLLTSRRQIFQKKVFRDDFPGGGFLCD